MSPFLSLAKTQINNTFSLSVWKKKYFQKKTRLWKPVAFILLMGFALLPFETGLIGFFNLFYTLMERVGLEASILTLLIGGGQLIVLFFGLFYLMSAFYFSGDLKLLLPLPLRSYEIIGAKLTAVLAGECLTLLPLVAPVFVLYGIRSGADWWYWPLALFIYILLPVIPLAFSSVLIIPLMRFTARAKNRDLFRIAGTMAGIAVFVLIQFVNRSGQEAGTQMQQLLPVGKNLSGTVASVFPPVNWATAALAAPSPGDAAINLLLFAAASCALLAPALLLAGKWFFRGVTAGYEVKSAKGSSGATAAPAYKHRGPVRAFFLREAKLFFRTPVFILNGLINYLMVPLFLFFSLHNNIAELGTENARVKLIIILIATGIIILNNALSPVAATAVSREGKTLWISKHLPLPARQQVTAKLFLALLFPVIGAGLFALLFKVLFNLTVTELLMIFVLGAAGSLPMAELGLIIDLLRPNLNWTDPQRAIKGFNGLLAFLAGIPVLGIAGATGALLVYLGLQYFPICLILTGLFILLGLALYRVLVNLAEKRYPQL